MEEGKIKLKKSRYYASIPVDYLRDKTLSFKAKGLLSYLLTNSEEWQLFKSSLSSVSTDGYASLMSAWKELEKAGYIETVRLKKGNLYASYEYIIHDSPVLAVFVNTSSREHENQQLKNILYIENNKDVNTNVFTNNKVDTKVSNVELTSSTSTEVIYSDNDKCRMFIERFNEIKIVNGKKSKYRTNNQICGKLKQRLKDYTSSEIFTVLRAAIVDEYHLKTGLQYVTPEYILRPNILDRFLNISKGIINSVKPEDEEERKLVY